MFRIALSLAVAATAATTSVLPQAGNSSLNPIPRQNDSADRSRPDSVRRSSGTFDLESPLHGVVRPTLAADMPSLVPGIITNVHVTEGQTVRKGDPLVSLDDRIPKARLEAATVEANLTGALKRAQVDQSMAESRLRRIRRILDLKAGADYELEEAEGAYEQATAAVSQQEDVLKAAEASRKLAEAQLNQYTISAPFDGVVTELHIKAGPVDPSQVVVSMANLDQLEVELHVPSRMFGQVRRGATMNLDAAAPVSGMVNSTVQSVSPIINSASNTFRCLLRIENRQQNLPAGFTVQLPNGKSAVAIR